MKVKHHFTDFETEREIWNRYELIEEAQIKAKAVLVKVVERKDLKNPRVNQIGIESKNLVTVLPSKYYRLQSSPNPRLPSPRQIADAERIDVSFDQLSEDWNIYRLEDGRKLKLKLVVTGIVRLKGLYDISGIPIYDIGSTVIFNIIGKKK